MCYLRLSKHYLMRHYSQNVQICVVPDIPLLCQSMHRVSITFLQKTMRMGMMGVHPLGQHHLGDVCLIRHLHPYHLKTRAKVRTLIPQFCQNWPLQGRLLLSHCLTTFMHLIHLPGDLLQGMILIPCTVFSIQTPLISISMIREQFFTRTEMIRLLHHG